VREWNAWASKWWTFNFNRARQGDGVISNSWVQFRNYWEVYGGLGVFRQAFDDRLTRGGPSAILPAAHFWRIGFDSDRRHVLSVSAGYNQDDTAAGGRQRRAELSVKLKPSPRLLISTGPEWSDNDVVAQYVTSIEDATANHTLGGRYVFGNLAQRQLTMTTRVNVILTPRLSIQVFAQPLLSVGDYTNIKELARPRTFDFLSYGTGIGELFYDPIARSYDVDPDGAGAAPRFTFDDPDFNFKSLRVNAVFRWELKPGSTFYAVWTRQQQDKASPGDFAIGRDTSALFSAPGDDIFLVKMAYWIGR